MTNINSIISNAIHAHGFLNFPLSIKFLPSIQDARLLKQDYFNHYTYRYNIERTVDTSVSLAPNRITSRNIGCYVHDTFDDSVIFYTGLRLIATALGCSHYTIAKHLRGNLLYNNRYFFT